MTLDERINVDLKELYNKGDLNGTISSAKRLQGVIADELSTKGMPSHFTGDRNAKTVIVMLNPGRNAYDKVDKKGKIMKGADNPDTLQEEIQKINIDTSSENNFIQSYINGKTNFGKLSQSNIDPFDLKQALFLKSWKGSGIEFPKNFPNDKSAYNAAVLAVLMDKLQLELIPFCSNGFKLRKKVPFYEYVETLFDEIFFKKREYVIFTSTIFQLLFGDANEMREIGASVKFGLKLTPKHPLTKRDGTAAKTEFNCMKITITYKGKEQKAMIAPTFFKQGIAGDILCQYGEFCYNEYIK